MAAPTFDTEAINDGVLAWPVATAIPGLSSFASRADQKLTVFLVNRLLATDLDVRVELHDLVASGEASLTVLSAPAPECTNEQRPDTVVSVRSKKVVEATGLTVSVPAHGLLLLSVDVQ